MKVLVTGATGFLGGLVTRQLLREGDVVRALVRPGRDGGIAGVEIAPGDLKDGGAIVDAVRGVDAVVHCGARVATTGPWAEFAAVNVDATGQLIRAAVDQGVRRLVHVSSLSVYAIDRDGACITEDSAYEDGAEDRGFYSRSKLAADRLCMEAAAAGAPVTVVRPGLLYGPGRRPPLGRRSVAVGRLRLVLGSPGYLLPLAYGDNIADAISHALRQPHAQGRAYTLVDAQVPMREYVPLYREITRGSWRAVFVPAALPLALLGPAAFAARLAGRRLPVSAHQIERTTWSAQFDCRRATGELGWTPRVSLREGLQRALTANGAAAAPSDTADRYSYETH